MELLYTKDYGHLGIVSGICEEIGLVSLIDKMTASDEQRKVSVGLATKAMIINGLGFVQKALYLTPQFYKDKPVDLLLGSEYVYEDFDSHALGSALDKLYEGGLTTIFFLVSLQARKLYGVKTTSRHLDGTTFSVHHNKEGEEGETGVVLIKHGYNKQNRLDVPQFLFELVCSNEAGIPEYLDFGDGNSNDKIEFPQVLKRFIAEMKKANEDWQSGHYVCDSALYSSKTIGGLEGILWISRVPMTIKECQDSIRQSWHKNKEWQCLEGHNGYYYQEKTTAYGGVKQNWLLLWSEASYERASKNVEKKVSKELADLEKGSKSLHKLTYGSLDLAKKSVMDWYKTLDTNKKEYYRIGSVEIKENKHYNKGRRNEGAIPKYIDYQIESIVFERKEEIIEKNKKEKSVFVLATNDLDKEHLSPRQMLHLYKNEQQKTERGFKFLKDPLFMLDKIFLTLPKRIMALGMVMGLCLLVYTLAQFKLRKALEDKDETLPNQLKKETKRPSMRWIFMLMQGTHVVYLKNGEQIIRLITNLDETKRKIISLMGDTIQVYYTTEA